MRLTSRWLREGVEGLFEEKQGKREAKGKGRTGGGVRPCSAHAWES